MTTLQRFVWLWSLVWKHPANRGARLSASLRVLRWQLQKRFTFWPMTVPVGTNRRFRIVHDSKFSSLVYYNRLPDWDEMNFLLRALRPTDGFIDIGANVGFYTILASTKVAPRNIHAIEANPANIRVLSDQLELNGLSEATVHPCAVGASRTQARFQGVDRETGQVTQHGTDQSYEVDVRPLDDLVPAPALPPDVFAKMDVEGYEVEVLLGACELLARRAVSVWLFELSDDNLRRHHRSAGDLLERLRDQGYSFFSWNETTRKLLPAQPLGGECQNYIACCRGAEWLAARLAS
jgi:FkbM family methyltransferase